MMAAQAHPLSILSISASTSQSNRGIPQSSSLFQLTMRCQRLGSSFFANELSIGPLTAKLVVPKRQRTVATVLLSLPTAKPERSSPEKLPKWSARSIRSFAMGKVEARKLKYLTTGTEALLLGILVEGTSLAAKFLRANGITFYKVQEATVDLLGKSDLYVFSPEDPPLTEQAQRALDWAVDAKLKSGESGEITPTHLLLGIWSEKESAGHMVLASLGFNDEKAKELEKLMDQDVVLP